MDTYIVLKNFKDSKNDFSLHKEGEDVELSKERAEEISKQGEFIKLKSAAKAKEEKVKGGKTKEEKESADTIKKIEKADTGDTKAE